MKQEHYPLESFYCEGCKTKGTLRVLEVEVQYFDQINTVFCPETRTISSEGSEPRDEAELEKTLLKCAKCKEIIAEGDGIKEHLTQQLLSSVYQNRIQDVEKAKRRS